MSLKIALFIYQELRIALQWAFDNFSVALSLALEYEGTNIYSWSSMIGPF